MPVFPTRHVDKEIGDLSVWEACPQTGRSFSNVNVIQIYGKQIDGCWGYGGLDTVYVIEMHTDKNVCPRASAALWRPRCRRLQARV